MHSPPGSYRLGMITGIVYTLTLCRERLGLPAWTGIGLGLAVVGCSLLWQRQYRAAVVRGEVAATFTPAQRRRGFWQALGLCALTCLVSPFLLPWLYPSVHLSPAWGVGISAFVFLQTGLLLGYYYFRRSPGKPKV